MLRHLSSELAVKRALRIFLGNLLFLQIIGDNKCTFFKMLNEMF